MKGFSIIVCCYNSAELLPETLERLALLHLPAGMNAELIVIDNCCTDDTVLVAKKQWKNFGEPLKMIIAEEKTPGLSFAREKGISLAQYEYLLFCDDDNLLNNDYLLTAEGFLSAHPQAGVLGGYGEPVYDRLPSFWPKDFFIYGSGPQAKKNGKTSCVHGAGAIIRQKAFSRLKKAGFSFILSDRKKDMLTSGGDYELCYAIILAGYEVWYHQELKFSHYISPGRTTWRYCKKFIEESAPALDVLNVYHYIIINDDKKTSLCSFYLVQIKNWLFHLKHYASSSYLKYKYHRREDIYFLEKFHQKFHGERLKCTFRNIFYYKKIYNKINALNRGLRLSLMYKQQKPEMKKEL
jgi:glycosyltransferase involved in cell wall biosynthesis